jgi:hypothetical protein
MTTGLAYLRLVLFLGGVLFGVQIPGFVDQYGKNLEAHFRESVESLREFQQDADRFFGGDIKRLIAHYKIDDDPVFNAGGDSINSIYLRNIELREALLHFKKRPFNAYTQVFISPVSDMREEVWESYTYSIKLDFSAISMGLVAGLILAVSIEIFVRSLIGGASMLSNRSQPNH